jgi:hypothetical protein
VPLATALCKNLPLRILNDSLVGQNPQVVEPTEIINNNNMLMSHVYLLYYMECYDVVDYPLILM